MDNETKDFIKVVCEALALLLTIAASAGCISYGVVKPDYFYVVVGLFNLLGWGGLVVYRFIKDIKEKRK